MRKIVIHPDYASLAGFINRLPDIFHTEGQTIFKARNEIKVFEQQGMELIVKSFKIPHIINQVVYTTLRSSKAERAYQYAIVLLHKGIATPTPVAYIEIKKYGILFNSFFISVKSRFQHEIKELCNAPATSSENCQVLSGLAHFTACLHEKGFYHKDYSPRNILFGKTGDHYEFELIDLNRMKFGKVSIEAGCKQFNRLCFNDELHRFLVQEYVHARQSQAPG